MRIPLITIQICLFFLLSCTKETQPPVAEADQPALEKTISLNVDGNDRSMIIYLPSGYNKAGKIPMILSIHGGGGTPLSMVDLANFRIIAEREKFAIVYPAGIQNNWNDGRPTTPNQLGINDVNFFSSICDYMIANFSVDAGRIYATGISNGGFMSSRLACELSNKIAAIASVAASMEATTIAPNCKPSRSVPVLYIQGTLDPLVPFLGGVGTAGAGGTILSHAQVIDKWMTLNTCGTIPAITDIPDTAGDGTTIRQRVFVNAANGVEVVSYVVNNGGHTWPLGKEYLPESIIGKTSKNLNACEAIWTFFKKYKR
jgi:polyhydroxybutyrate depolymerase